MACPLAHGAKEQLYHPHFYKTSPCSEGNCKRGPLCAFTHGEADTRGPAPAPISAEEAASKAMQGPMQWAEATLAHHQPSYCNPPRYHALEEQVNVRKGGKGGKKQSTRYWEAQPAFAVPNGRRIQETGSSKRRQARPAQQYQQGTEELGKAAQPPVWWQMAAVYTEEQPPVPLEQQQLPYGFTAPVLWAQQGSLPDNSVQGYPAPYLNMQTGDASARFVAPGGIHSEEASPISAAMAAANACGSPLAVPITSSANYTFSVPSSMWGGLTDKVVEARQGPRSRARKGQGPIRTPSSFGSLGSPRESCTPTDTPRTPRTPRPGEEVATSSQTSSSANTSGQRPRTLSADRGVMMEGIASKVTKGHRHRTLSVDDRALVRTPTKGTPPTTDEPPTKSTSWASSESA